MNAPRYSLFRRSFPTPFLIVGSLTKTRRRIWCLSAVLLAIVAGPALWWAMQLNGLPDVGDPFDVAAFRAFTIPDDRNAFVLYRQAAALLDANVVSLKTVRGKVDWFSRWSEPAHDAEFLMLLAEALYRRDHGTDPPSAQALVGAYLERLPEYFQTGQKDAQTAGARSNK